MAAQPGMNSNVPPPADSAMPMVAPSSARPGSVPASSNSGTLPGTAKASSVRPSGSPAASASATGRAERQFAARHQGAVQHVEDGIGIERRERRRAGIQREGLAFAQGQQAGDGVDLAPRSARWRRSANGGAARARHGCRAGVAATWARRSGEAFSSTQRRPSALTASDAWVRDGAAGSPARGAPAVPDRRSSIAETRRRRRRRDDRAAATPGHSSAQGPGRHAPGGSMGLVQASAQA